MRIRSRKIEPAWKYGDVLRDERDGQRVMVIGRRADYLVYRYDVLLLTGASLEPYPEVWEGWIILDPHWTRCYGE